LLREATHVEQEVSLMSEKINEWAKDDIHNKPGSLRRHMIVANCEVLVYEAGVGGRHSDEPNVAAFLLICPRCVSALKRATVKTPPFGARFDVGFLPSHLPQLSSVEKIALQLHRPHACVLVSVRTMKRRGDLLDISSDRLFRNAGHETAWSHDFFSYSPAR
jgi:hypothetical protein